MNEGGLSGLTVAAHTPFEKSQSDKVAGLTDSQQKWPPLTFAFVGREIMCGDFMVHFEWADSHKKGFWDDAPILFFISTATPRMCLPNPLCSHAMLGVLGI